MVDLSQIVILGGKPEYRDTVDTRRGSLFRQFDRGQCLENRKQRPSEQTHLLPRNCRQRASAEPLNIRHRLRRSPPGTVLPLQNFAHLAPTRGIVNDVLRFVFHPLRKNWRPWIHHANGRSVREIIKEKTRSVRNLAERQTLRFHRQLPRHLSIHPRTSAIRIVFVSIASQPAQWSSASKVALSGSI